MLQEGLTTGQAAKYISRHPKTLQAMDRAGVVPARRTAGGRRYGLQPDLDRYWGRTAGERPRRTVCYFRGSSQAQRPGLKKQERKRTRLNSSHPLNSYAVFCLEKKKKKKLRHNL